MRRGRHRGGRFSGFGGEFPEFGPEFRGFGPFTRGRGRRRKMLDGEELRLLVLDFLGEEPRHGYDLIRAFEDLSGGAYAPSPGVVYPLLAMLADEELIVEAEAEGARKPYRLTEAGAELRAQTADIIASLKARIGSLAESRRHMDSEPARRAMHNLRDAVIGRLSRSDADEAVLFKTVEILDGAAQQIERL